MSPLDYKADIRVRCLVSDEPDFTQGKIYECFSVSSCGNAKVIDNQREENYLIAGDFEIEE